jgi:hypothetical protein
VRPEIRRDAKHAYYVGEETEPWPSVTTVISATTAKDALGWWGQKVACDGIVEMLRRGVLGTFSTGEELVEMLKANKLTVNHVLSGSAQRGARIHGLLEHYGKTGEIIPPEEFPENYRGQIGALATWILANDPEFLGQEVMTCSPTHRYAGTLDLRCRIDGKTYLVDLKTSKRVYPTHFVQLEAYEHAEVELGEEPSDIRAVLHLPEGGEARLVEVPATYSVDDFLCLLQSYNRMQLHKRKRAAA